MILGAGRGVFCGLGIGSVGRRWGAIGGWLKGGEGGGWWGGDGRCRIGRSGVSLRGQSDERVNKQRVKKEKERVRRGIQE